jgi:flagellar FliL protein
MATTTKSKTAAPDEGETAAPAPAARRKKMMIGAGGVVALAAAWFLLLGPGAGAEAEEEHAEPQPGPVLTLDPITMNLADGRLLKVGLALQLPIEEGEHGGEFSGAVALDEAIAFLGEHTYDQLAAPEGRAQVKVELAERVAERYHGGVLDVYFTQFVMQ